MRVSDLFESDSEHDHFNKREKHTDSDLDRSERSLALMHSRAREALEKMETTGELSRVTMGDIGGDNFVRATGYNTMVGVRRDDQDFEAKYKKMMKYLTVLNKVGDHVCSLPKLSSSQHNRKSVELILKGRLNRIENTIAMLMARYKYVPPDDKPGEFHVKSYIFDKATFEAFDPSVQAQMFKINTVDWPFEFYVFKKDRNEPPVKEFEKLNSILMLMTDKLTQIDQDYTFGLREHNARIRIV